MGRAYVWDLCVCMCVNVYACLCVCKCVSVRACVHGVLCMSVLVGVCVWASILRPLEPCQVHPWLSLEELDTGVRPKRALRDVSRTRHGRARPGGTLWRRGLLGSGPERSGQGTSARGLGQPKSAGVCEGQGRGPGQALGSRGPAGHARGAGVGTLGRGAQTRLRVSQDSLPRDLSSGRSAPSKSTSPDGSGPLLSRRWAAVR